MLLRSLPNKAPITRHSYGTIHLQVFKQEGVVVNSRDFTYISLDLFYRPIQEYIWFRGGDLNHLKVVGWD